jgi:hypothetical protein
MFPPTGTPSLSSPPLEREGVLFWVRAEVSADETRAAFFVLASAIAFVLLCLAVPAQATDAQAGRLELAWLTVPPVRVVLEPSEARAFDAASFDAEAVVVPVTPTWQADEGPLSQAGTFTAEDLNPGRGGEYEMQLYLPAIWRSPECQPPATVWDSRLDQLGVGLEEVAAGPCSPHWHLISAHWADPAESAGLHHIFLDVLDADGERVYGQTVVVVWAEGSTTVIIEKPPGEPGGNFPMYRPVGSYDALVGGGDASDRVVSMGLGTIEEPDVKYHTSFYLTFQWVPSEDGEAAPPPEQWPEKNNVLRTRGR